MITSRVITRNFNMSFQTKIVVYFVTTLLCLVYKCKRPKLSFNWPKVMFNLHTPVRRRMIIINLRQFSVGVYLYKKKWIKINIMHTTEYMHIIRRSMIDGWDVTVTINWHNEIETLICFRVKIQYNVIGGE